MSVCRVTVQCLICGAQMQPEKQVAIVTHHYDPPVVTAMFRFVCYTPDCGNVIIAEGT